MNTLDAIGWALVHFIWQGAAVASVLAIALWLARGVDPRLRYGFALAALAALVCLPAATAVRLHGKTVVRTSTSRIEPEHRLNEDRAKPAEPARSSRLHEGIPASKLERKSPDSIPVPAAIESMRFSRRAWLEALVQPALPILALAWVAGVFFLSIRLLGGWMQAQRLARIGVRPAPLDCRAMANRLANTLHVRQAFLVLESTRVRVPAVVGWLRPVILVPASAFTGLNPRQLELLLAHELAHLRRHDYLVNLLQSLVETLLFYHPATWWVSARMRAERELCCDDLVVATCGDAPLYARTLVDLESWRGSESALSPTAAGGSLLSRVRRLLGSTRPDTETFPRWAAGAMGLATALGVVLVTLFSSATPTQSAGAKSTPQITKAPAQTSKTSSTQPQAPIAVHPDPGVPLAERWSWALETARTRGLGDFWIGYLVRPNPALDGPVFMGHLGDGDEITSHGMSVGGHITHIGDWSSSEWTFPGSRLDVRGDRDAVAMIYEMHRTNGKPMLRHAHAASLVIPVNLHGQPLLWLGSAGDPESTRLVEDQYAATRDLDAQVDLVGMLGVHSSTSIVAPLLVGHVQSDAKVDVRKAAVEWLGRHPTPESLSTLAHAARTDRSADVRREAAESAGEMRLDAASDTAIALARTLDDSDARREAVESLGGRTDARSLAALIDFARHEPNESIAREAIEALGERKEPAAVETLQDLVNSQSNPQLRREAVETLGEVLPPETARQVLRDIAASNSSSDARREAVETLSQLQGGIGLRDVEKIAVENPDPEVRREAVEKLGQNLDEDRAIDLLGRIAISDPSLDVQREAVETLGQRPERRAKEQVLRFSREHPSSDVRREAVETLGEALQPKEAIPILVEVARRDSDPQVLDEALETLEQLPGGEGIPALIELARQHPDSVVRREALRRLVESDDPRAKSFLEKALQEH